MRIGRLIGWGFLASAILLPVTAMATPVKLVCERPNGYVWTMEIDADAGTADGYPAEYSPDTIKWQVQKGSDTLGYSDAYTLDRTSGKLVDQLTDFRSSSRNGTSVAFCKKGAQQF